jgi:hypothetical protein
MKVLRIITLLIILVACRPEDAKTTKLETPAAVDTQKGGPSHATSSIEVIEQQDQTEEIYAKIKDVFSGSWKYPHASNIDGDREVSWGTVPFSNQSYFIIDFQNSYRILIRGATEGGKKGFDRYIGDVYKMEEKEGLYHFFYKNTISTRNPNKKHEIVLRYNSENDTMAIIGYGDNVYENPSEMIRISEPLHKERF